MKFKVRVTVTLKNGVLDPQGKAIQSALGSLGFGGVDAVRQGKVFDLVVDADNADSAETAVKTMCEKLLANMVVENYTIHIHN